MLLYDSLALNPGFYGIGVEIFPWGIPRTLNLQSIACPPTCYNFLMTLTLAEVEHIAELARLQLTDEEKILYREQLSAILDYAARLQALDTSGISPTSSVLPARSVLRPDEPRPGLDLADLMRNAPDTEAGQFRVPPVLE
jgi:aspartyl-tRNA(Asn)/glutamyl-tRNA(Gln) amidotransferase subunit C